MKTLTILMMVAVVFSLIYGIMNYSDIGKGVFHEECEFKQLEDGWTQLENCVIYKLDIEKWNNIGRLR